MNDPKTFSSPDPKSDEGFRISDAPVVRSKGFSAAGNGALSGSLPGANDTDLLYVIARDPRSLFVYWDLNWARVFDRARLSARQVQLRIYRETGQVEVTREINPFLGHCYAEVAATGTGYYCELGCFDDETWASLVRSGKAATPEDRMSEELSAEFATLPLHLSFQRMLDILRATQAEGASLARSVAALQGKGRSTPDANGTRSADLSALWQAAEAGAATPEEHAQWTKLAEELAGASWGGASGSGFGGSSPA